MIIVIVGKQSTCPNEKQKDSRRVSNLVLTAHAGTFIRPRNLAARLPFKASLPAFGIGEPRGQDPQEPSVERSHPHCALALGSR